MKKSLCILLLLGAVLSAGAQSIEGLWQQAPALPELYGQPALKPKQFQSFTTAESGLRDLLAAAPQDYERAIFMELPAPDGSLRSFQVWNTPAMEDGLAKAFPGITTYTAEAVGAPHITAKLDYTPGGFHALVFDTKGSYLIDPYGETADGAYVVYYHKDMDPDALQFSCGTQGHLGESDEPGLIGSTGTDRAPYRINGAQRRKYRLALACSGEYAVRVAGASPTKAAVLAVLVTLVNRTNGIFERELAISMQLIANDTAIIYLSGSTDPYTNSNTSLMLSENQSNLDTRIGNANYDIGHVMSTSSPGLGMLGCVCSSGSKAKGTTFYSSSNTYMILAHEMGHQLGSHHTFNGSDGSCNGNGNASTAFEPGSGSTIMSYGGLCATHNIQSFSDSYYHGRSLEIITTYIANSGSCGTTTPSTNANAVMQPFAATYAIPYKTPFELTAPLATDVTKDTLTYCWEERDLGSFGMSLAQTGIYGPLFRTFPPSTSRTRVFPRIEVLIGKMAIMGEKLPDTARSLAFRVTERDIYQGWGCFNYPDDSIRLNVINTKIPFTVIYPAPNATLATGSWPTIRWNVASTNAAPINCTAVDIYLSVDSGYTFPYLLRGGTPNDGQETLQLPTVATTTGARIKVKGANNVFFNLSGNFTLYKGSMSTAQAALEAAVKLSPVPAHDVLHLDLPQTAGLRVDIYNTLGQVVWSATGQGRVPVDVSRWARGIYQVRVSGADGAVLRRKILIQ